MLPLTETGFSFVTLRAWSQILVKDESWKCIFSAIFGQNGPFGVFFGGVVPNVPLNWNLFVSGDPPEILAKVSLCSTELVLKMALKIDIWKLVSYKIVFKNP